MPRKTKIQDAHQPSEPRSAAETSSPNTPSSKPLNKLDTLANRLRQDGGATLAELTAATGWQAHSVRGAMAGALKQRGLQITSTKTEGVRRYAVLEAPAQ
jgi:hypothetical protein